LTTVAPVAAATKAAIVEMLTVFIRSPPEPTTSTAGPGTVIGVANASNVSTMPVISVTVSPLARSAINSAASWAEVASPARTCSIAHAVAAAGWSSRRTRAASSSGQVVVVIGSGHPGAKQAGSHGRQSQRIDRVRHHTVGAGPGRQPRIVDPAGQDQDRWATRDLVLELAA
jgi:hypothetical protein